MVQVLMSLCILIRFNPVFLLYSRYGIAMQDHGGWESHRKLYQIYLELMLHWNVELVSHFVSFV